MGIKIWQSCNVPLLFQFMKYYKQMGSFKNVRKLLALLNVSVPMDLILKLQN